MSSGPDRASGLTELTLAERQAILGEAVAAYVRDGYTVVSTWDASAKLTRVRQVPMLVFWGLLALIGVGWVILWLLLRRDRAVFLTVDSYGRLTRQ